jgi:hypothetical protein
VSDKPKRRWYQFSLRAILALMTLVCIYFASWQATKSIGLRQVVQFLHDSPLREEDGAWRYPPWDVTSPMPLVVGTTEWSKYHGSFCFVRRHYVWFFGLTIKTPIAWKNTGKVSPYPTPSAPAAKLVKISRLKLGSFPKDRMGDFNTPPPALGKSLEMDRSPSLPVAP